MSVFLLKIVHKLLCLTGFALVFIGLCASHSWIECADYRTDTVLTSNDYNRDDCNGFTRGWNTFTFDNFGEDHGQDFEIKLFNEDRMCDKTIGSPEDGYSDSYDSDNPMPSYTVGQTVKLLWPAKNHANNEDCDYNYEPDHALKLFINSEPDPTEDPSKNQSDWTLVHDWHEGYTFDEINTYGYDGLKSRNGIKGVGFQHCPWYCDNTDLAICFGNFTVPNIFPRDGYYTFLWYWRKNAVRTYTSCWEAYVSGTSFVTTDENGQNSDDDGSNGNQNEDDLGTGNSQANTEILMLVGAAVGGTLVICILFLCVFFACRRRIKKQGNSKGEAGLAGVIATGGTKHAITVAPDTDDVRYGVSHDSFDDGARPVHVPPRPPPPPMRS